MDRTDDGTEFNAFTKVRDRETVESDRKGRKGERKEVGGVVGGWIRKEGRQKEKRQVQMKK